MSLVIVIELGAAPSVILPRRWLITGVGLAVAGWSALALRDGGALFRDHAVFMGGTVVMVVVGHVIHTRAVIRAEHARADTEEANARLRGELDERLRAEAERERYREELVAAQRLEAIGTLAGGLSHDMNNILAGILGAADGLKAAPAAEVPDLARKIADEATRGADLTRSLLAFSRRGRYQHKAVPIAAAVDDVVAVLRRTASKRVALAVHHERRDLVVDGDPAQLPQVILNLVANAVQAIHDPGDHPGPDAPAEAPHAGRAGEVSIVTSLHTGEGGAHHVVIEVGDTGAGMDDETREHIFEPFFTTKATGRGLGLAMVWGTIEAHHGTIDVDTAPGRGTTMRVRLPARIDPSYAPAPAPVLDTSPAPAPAGRQLHVLLVDDEPLVRSMFERALKRAGMRVTGAAHGLDALERFADASPPIDAVVLDMAMPVMGGAECFRRLRERQPHLPIVIASGYTGDAEIRTLVATGAAAFLEKPFRMEALVSALQGLIA
jgi:signal transduction histidine kinase